MTVSSTNARGIDYAPCRYNGSRLWYRGPVKSLRTPCVACVGDCAVYGRYVARPCTQCLQDALGTPCINLGVEHAGIDAIMQDPGALATLVNAQQSIIQITGAQHTSNRYYSVHPRRNDRFLKASPALVDLYPEMDFTDVHFTGHLLEQLRGISKDRFLAVSDELRKAWTARMMGLLSRLKKKPVLLWFAPRHLDHPSDLHPSTAPFLTRDDIAPLLPHALALVECVPDAWNKGLRQEDFAPHDMVRMTCLPGPDAHEEAASQLLAVVQPLLETETARP